MITSPEGLKEVKVRAWTFTKISTVYTDAHGQYRMNKSFRFNPRYHIVFKNKIGYCIRGNANIFTCAEFYLGQHSNRGVTYNKHSLEIVMGGHKNEWERATFTISESDIGVIEGKN